MTSYIAMWSGPRNISTAMMRSFDSRPDTFVSDEPFYAHYLQQTGHQHPGYEGIVSCGECDARKVVDQITGPIPNGKTLWYQKHMCHHMLDSVNTDWLDDDRFRHAFLIRSPRAMLVSLSKVIADPTIEQTGLPQQVAIFDRVCQATGVAPVVVDSRHILLHPETSLRRLCGALEIQYIPSMLSWQAGRRPTDGVWAEHWYANVERSTGFGPYVSRHEPLPERYRGLLEQCQVLYDRLARHANTSDTD